MEKYLEFPTHTIKLPRQPTFELSVKISGKYTFSSSELLEEKVYVVFALLAY